MDNIISSFYNDLSKRPELRSIIPIGYNPGIPMLSVKEDNLCLTIPYLRYKITGEKDHDQDRVHRRRQLRVHPRGRA